MTLTRRRTKGSQLTSAEADANLDHLELSSNHTFTQSGTGAIATTAQTKLRELPRSPEDFASGTVTATDLQEAIDACNAAGGGVVHGDPSKTYTLNSQVTIPANVKLDLRNATVTTSQTNANVPTHFFKFTGSNSSVENVRFSIDMANLDTSSRGRCFGLNGAATLENIAIRNIYAEEPWSVIYADGLDGTPATRVQINNLTVENVTGKDCVRYDIFLSNVYGENWKIQYNSRGALSHSTPAVSLCNVVIEGGARWTGIAAGSVSDNTDDTTIETYPVRGLRLDFGCEAANGFPVFLRNIDGLHLGKIEIDGITGDKATAGCSNDAVFLEFCRNVTGDSIVVHASGENGIDFLGVQEAALSSVVLKQCDDVGLMFFQPDFVTLGYGGSISRKYKINRNINIASLVNEAGVRCQFTNIEGLTIGTATFAEITHDTTPTQNGDIYFNKSGITTVSSISMKNVKKRLLSRVAVTVDNTTDQITFTNDHGLGTGHRCQIIAETTQPTGTDTTTDYYAIRVSATVIKLATSLANSLTGTAVDITSNGTAVYFYSVKGGSFPGFGGSIGQDDVAWKTIELCEDIALTSPWRATAAGPSNGTYAHSQGNWARQSYALRIDPSAVGSTWQNYETNEFPINHYVNDGTNTYGVYTIMSVWQSIRYGFGVYLSGNTQNIGASFGAGIEDIAAGATEYIRVRAW